jgi:hypothetical protein
MKILSYKGCKSYSENGRRDGFREMWLTYLNRVTDSKKLCCVAEEMDVESYGTGTSFCINGGDQRKKNHL